MTERTIKIFTLGIWEIRLTIRGIAHIHSAHCLDGYLPEQSEFKHTGIHFQSLYGDTTNIEQLTRDTIQYVLDFTLELAGPHHRQQPRVFTTVQQWKEIFIHMNSFFQMHDFCVEHKIINEEHYYNRKKMIRDIVTNESRTDAHNQICLERFMTHCTDKDLDCLLYVQEITVCLLKRRQLGLSCLVDDVIYEFSSYLI